jgi:hypothetical protein
MSMLSWPKMTVATVLAGTSARTFPAAAAGPPMPDPQQNAAAIREVAHLAGAELGLAVAREVMHWRSDHEQFADCWVDENGKLTGYYYGHPFSPYRDRNALAEVWKRIDALGLRDRYLQWLDWLLHADHGDDAKVGSWTLHTCGTELACRAALLAVREA